MGVQKEAIERKEALEALLRSQGWDILLGILREQVQTRTNLVMLSKVDSNGLYAQEFTKGEVAALRMVINLPRALVDNFNSELRDVLDVAERSELTSTDTNFDGNTGIDDDWPGF